VVVGPDDAAESDMSTAQIGRLALADVEKPMSQPAAAKVRQQHGFGAIENVGQRQARPGKGLGEVVGMVGHRRAGRRPHQPVAIEGAGDHRAGAAQIGLQIPPLVVQIAVVEIGPVPEHRDPERGHLIQPRRHLVRRQRPDDHAETCAIQS
jgi:hypothetical protein